MQWLPLLLVVLCALAGVFRAFHDCLTHSPVALAKWGPFWDASTSWTRKYKDYYNDPKTPRFWGATTVFVAWTDAWHASNALLGACWAVIALLACWLGWASIWWLVAGLLINKLIFEPLYSFLRK